MSLITINTRQYFIDCTSIEVQPVSAGRWNVVYDRAVDADGEVINEGRTFLVVGGRASGGAANEWFCHHPEFYGEAWLPCRSMIEAIRKGVAY